LFDDLSCLDNGNTTNNLGVVNNGSRSMVVAVVVMMVYRDSRSVVMVMMVMLAMSLNRACG